KGGLALATILLGSEPKLKLRFFDGRTTVRSLICCRIPYSDSPDRAVVRNRIVAIDRGSSTPPVFSNPETFLANLAVYGGPIVVMDPRGGVVEKSAITVDAGLVVPSPRGDRLAFWGRLRGPMTRPDTGLYVAGLQEKSARKLMAWHPPRPEKL